MMTKEVVFHIPIQEYRKIQSISTKNVANFARTATLEKLATISENTELTRLRICIPLKKRDYDVLEYIAYQNQTTVLEQLLVLIKSEVNYLRDKYEIS